MRYAYLLVFRVIFLLKNLVVDAAFTMSLLATKPAQELSRLAAPFILKLICYTEATGTFVLLATSLGRLSTGEWVDKCRPNSPPRSHQLPLTPYVGRYFRTFDGMVMRENSVHTFILLRSLDILWEPRYKCNRLAQDSKLVITRWYFWKKDTGLHMCRRWR